jgi:hypothetical protein
MVMSLTRFGLFVIREAERDDGWSARRSDEPGVRTLRVPGMVPRPTSFRHCGTRRRRTSVICRDRRGRTSSPRSRPTVDAITSVPDQSVDIWGMS